MRDRTYCLGALFIFLLIVFGLIAPAAEAATVLDKVVAVVNDDVITWSELYRAMEMDATPQLKALNPSDKRKVFRENETSFLENLINLKLQVQEAQKMGIRVADDEVNESIDAIKKKYSLSDDQLRESLSREGYTLDEYRRKMYEQILVSKVVNQLIRTKIVLNDKEVAAYLAENPAMAENTESYRIRQILFKRPKTAEEKSTIESRAADIVAKVRGGADFAELARKFSEDPSAASGGDLGVISKGLLAKDFVAALAPLKPGDIADPFWSDAGLHILKLEEKTAPKSKAELDEEVRSKLIGKVFMERYNSWIKSLRETAFIEVRD